MNVNNSNEIVIRQKKSKTKSRRGFVDAPAASTIEPESIKWLWPLWIALGKLTLVAGQGGCGKTTLLLSLIATTSSGGWWPDKTRCMNRGKTIIWSGEDDANDTIVPRLIAAGADLSKVHIVTGRIDVSGKNEPFDPAVDFDILGQKIEEIGNVNLLMIDPIVSFVVGDMHKANDVRRSLMPIVEFANNHCCAVVGVTHFSKGGLGSPADRVIGSQAFSALARGVLVAAKNEETGQCVLARAKSNISEDNGGVEYTIESSVITAALTGEIIETTKTIWQGVVKGSARKILMKASSALPTGEENPKSVVGDASAFLVEILSNGVALESNELQKKAEEAGFSYASLRRAKDRLGIKAKKIADNGRNGGGHWVWQMPRAHDDVPHVITRS